MATRSELLDPGDIVCRRCGGCTWRPHDPGPLTNGPRLLLCEGCFATLNLPVGTVAIRADPGISDDALQPPSPHMRWLGLLESSDSGLRPVALAKTLSACLGATQALWMRGTLLFAPSKWRDEGTAERVTITLEASGAGAPLMVRLRRFLKFALRTFGLRCVRVAPFDGRGMPVDDSETG